MVIETIAYTAATQLPGISNFTSFFTSNVGSLLNDLVGGIFGSKKSDNKERTALSFKNLENTIAAVQNNRIEEMLYHFVVSFQNMLQANSIRAMMIHKDIRAWQIIGFLNEKGSSVLSGINQGKDTLTATQEMPMVAELINGLIDFIYWTTNPETTGENLKYVRDVFIIVYLVLVRRSNYIPSYRESFQATQNEIGAILGQVLGVSKPVAVESLVAGETQAGITTIQSNGTTGLSGLNINALLIPALIYLVSQGGGE